MDELRDGEMLEVRLPLLLLPSLSFPPSPRSTDTGLSCVGGPHRRRLLHRPGFPLEEHVLPRAQNALHARVGREGCGEGEDHGVA